MERHHPSWLPRLDSVHHSGIWPSMGAFHTSSTVSLYPKSDRPLLNVWMFNLTLGMLFICSPSLTTQPTQWCISINWYAFQCHSMMPVPLEMHWLGPSWGASPCNAALLPPAVPPLTVPETSIGWTLAVSLRPVQVAWYVSWNLDPSLYTTTMISCTQMGLRMVVLWDGWWFCRSSLWGTLPV